MWLWNDVDSVLDLFLLANRLALGGFFILARFRWVYDPSKQDRWFNLQRHDSLCRKLDQCGFGNSWALSAVVALGEILGGASLIVGLLTVPAALGLAVVLLCAIITNSHLKVVAQGPVDRIHCVECFLWTPEGWMLLSATMLVVMGPGALSLDATLWSLL